MMIPLMRRLTFAKVNHLAIHSQIFGGGRCQVLLKAGLAMNKVNSHIPPWYGA